MQHIKPRCDCGTRGVGLGGEERRVLGTVYPSNAWILQAGGTFERMQCVCVTGTAGLAAPQESENASFSNLSARNY